MYPSNQVQSNNNNNLDLFKQKYFSISTFSDRQVKIFFVVNDRKYYLTSKEFLTFSRFPETALIINFFDSAKIVNLLNITFGTSYNFQIEIIK